MLFNSILFIFFFLPITLGGFYFALARVGRRAAFGWLVLASLVFYGWWNPAYLGMLVGLMLANFVVARAIVVAGPGTGASRRWLMLGVAANLGLLGYFKYTDFFIQTVNDLARTQFPLLHIMLPLAISFFTFQKIAFLVDCYRGIAREDSLLDYMLFVGFFPQLIAGPIVHHQEIMPQFRAPAYRGADAKMIAMGLTLFIIGLFKKCVLADCAAISANTVYDAAEHAGAALSMVDAWGGALAYSFQIYFDFSGYSDMAIGLALMFGVRLPDNFLSPYKSTGMIEFWRRWHITLSRFLRDYLYVPLGGNRCGKIRQGFNVVITMLLGGLWHGASWNFVLWGLLHGAMIAANHGLRNGARRFGLVCPAALRLVWSGICVAITFALVTVLWVFFRAETFAGAGRMLQAMAGQGKGFGPGLLDDTKNILWMGGMLAVVWGLPSSMSFIFGNRGRLAWNPAWYYALLSGALAVIALLFMQSHLGKQFIYFDF